MGGKLIVVNEALQVLLRITSAYLCKSGCSVTYKRKNKLHKWMEPEHVLRRGLSAIKQLFTELSKCYYVRIHIYMLPIVRFLIICNVFLISLFSYWRIYIFRCFYLNFIKFLLIITLVLLVHFSYFIPVSISDSWGYGTNLLALSKSRLKKLRNSDMDNCLVSYVTICLVN
jgi:hypothetical protein